MIDLYYVLEIPVDMSREYQPYTFIDKVSGLDWVYALGHFQYVDDI